MDRAARPAPGRRNERGAALVLVALTLVLVMVSGALAVDLSATARRGQTLQNAADAAALAGVRTWVETGDAALAEATVADILNQNGVVGAGTSALISYPSATELDVTLTDSETESFLAGFAGGGGDGGLTRGATARFERCDEDCTYEVEIPPPFRDVEARGSGDGYKPIPVGNRLYALHHGGSQIVCIDRSTEDTCWGSAATYAYPSGHGGHNPQMPHAVVHDDLIWWTASDGGGTKLFCWNTITDVACPSPVTLDAGLRQATPLDYRDEMRGGGTVMVGGRIFVFTDNHEVHCFDPDTVSICAGYAGGLDSGLGEANFPANDPTHGNHGGSIDRVTFQGRVYWTLRIVNEQPIPGPADCSAPLYEPDDGDTVVLRNAATGQYLAADAGDGTEMVSDGSLSRVRWTVDEDGEFSFRNVSNGRYLDGDSPDAVVQTSASRGGDDWWELRDWEGTGWKLKNKKRKGWLRHDRYDNVGLGADVIQEDDGDGAEWRWEIWLWECADPGHVPPPPPTLPYASGTWLDCFDTTVGAPCSDFTPQRVHTNGLRFNGRLFFFRDTVGMPTGVCSTGFDGSISASNFEIQCHYLDGQGHDGAENTSMSGQMNLYQSHIDDTIPSSPSSWGDPHWNDWTNRLYYPAHHDANRLYCWDFANQSYCGSRWQQTSGGNTTEDYGYFSEGNCVYALGHNSWFWAFNASNIEDPCTGSSASTIIHPCNCGVTMQWGTLTFDIDFEAFTVFDVQLFDPDGTIVQIDGRDTWSVIDDGLEVDLDDVPTTSPWLEVRVTVEAEGDPWAAGSQTFHISFSRTPVLTD